MERLLSLQKEIQGIQGIHGTITRWKAFGHAFFSINPGKYAIQ
jgi:hypothetical protein